MSEALKPCPFCGYTSVYPAERKSGDYVARFISCPRCGCEGPRADGGADEAAKWNRRSIDPATASEVARLRAALARSDRLLAAFRNRDIVTHGSTGWRAYTSDGCTICDTLEAAWRVLGIVEGEADATR